MIPAITLFRGARPLHSLASDSDAYYTRFALPEMKIEIAYLHTVTWTWKLGLQVCSTAHDERVERNV